MYTLRTKLEYNAACIITILYSIVCMTRDKGAINTLAFSLGAKKGDDAQKKRCICTKEIFGYNCTRYNTTMLQ